VATNILTNFIKTLNGNIVDHVAEGARIINMVFAKAPLAEAV
jgi:hypothetical protein